MVSQIGFKRTFSQNGVDGEGSVRLTSSQRILHEDQGQMMKSWGGRMKREKKVERGRRRGGKAGGIYSLPS
jgi:hypothetical protein